MNLDYCTLSTGYWILSWRMVASRREDMSTHLLFKVIRTLRREDMSTHLLFKVIRTLRREDMSTHLLFKVIRTENFRIGYF